MTIAARWAALTHVGVVRSMNQDAVVDAPPVFAVADGMGGHAAGDIASRIAVEHLSAFSGAAAIDSESAVAACLAANAEILRRSRADPALAGMGTTVAGVALSRTVDGDGVLVFNAGDSRIYLCQAGAVVQISKDHSLVAEMVAAQEITDEEARHHPQRNVVTRALGIEDDVEIDTWALPGSTEGQRFLICSDGLTNELSDAELGWTMAKKCTPAECAQELLDLALERGARDNVSVVIVDITAETRPNTLLDADTTPRLVTMQPVQPVVSDLAGPLISSVPDFGGVHR